MKQGWKIEINSCGLISISWLKLKGWRYFAIHILPIYCSHQWGYKVEDLGDGMGKMHTSFGLGPLLLVCWRSLPWK